MKAIFSTLLFCLSTLYLPLKAQTFRSVEGVVIGEISVVELAGNGDAWVGTAGNGVYFYHKSDSSWIHYTVGGNAAMLNDTINGITVIPIGPDSYSFIGTNNGLVFIKNGTVANLPALTGTKVTGVAAVLDSATFFNIVATTPNGVQLIDTAGLQVRRVYNTGNSAMPFDDLDCATTGGICNGFAGGNDLQGCFVSPDGHNYTLWNTTHGNMVDDRVNVMYREPNCMAMVVGTKGGLSICPPGQNCQNFTTSNGLPQNDVTSVTRDCHGNLWIGTRDSGAVVYNNVNFTRITTNNGLTSNQIKTVSFGGPDCQVWIGMADGNIAVVDSNKHVQNVLTSTTKIEENPTMVKIFPQPASGQVNFEFDRVIDNAQITIMDITGKTMLQLNAGAAQHYTADVSALANGIYFYQVLSGKQLIKAGKMEIGK